MVATPIPTAKVAGAINTVMRSVKKLAKTDENAFAKYNFVSIDNFLEHMLPLMAEAGLFIITDEAESEIHIPDGAKSGTLRAVYEFQLVHSSGEVWPEKMRRTVYVPANGAQATGSAQSYALKNFIRSAFLVPTGEKDDPDWQDNKAPITSKATKGRGKAAAEGTSVRMTEAESAEAVEGLMAMVFEVDTLEQLADFSKTHAGTYARLAPADQQRLGNSMRSKREAFERNADE